MTAPGRKRSSEGVCFRPVQTVAHISIFQEAAVDEAAGGVTGGRHPPRAQALQLPLSLQRALGSDLPRLLRPTHKAFAALAVPAQEALTEDIAALLERLNVAGKSSLVVPSEYLVSRDRQALRSRDAR